MLNIKRQTHIPPLIRNTDMGMIRKLISGVRNKWVAVMVKLTSGLSIKTLKIGLFLFVLTSTGIIISIIHSSLFQNSPVIKAYKKEIYESPVETGIQKNLNSLGHSHSRIQQYRQTMDSLSEIIKGQKLNDSTQRNLKLADSLRTQYHKKLK